MTVSVTVLLLVLLLLLGLFSITLPVSVMAVLTVSRRAQAEGSAGLTHHLEELLPVRWHPTMAAGAQGRRSWYFWPSYFARRYSIEPERGVRGVKKPIFAAATGLATMRGSCRG